MNYCDKIKYTILTTQKDSFPVMVDNLLSQLPVGESILRLTFFGTPSDNDQYLTRKEILKEKIATLFPECEPAISYVSQPPLNSPLIVEVHSYIKEEETDQIHYNKQDGLSYVILQNEYGKFLFAGGFQGDITHLSIEKQSAEVFQKMDNLLEKEGFPVNSIIRQWNYIEKITDYQGANQNYQSFNNARGDFYSKTVWDKGYPAATGIGTNLGGVVVDLDAVIFNPSRGFATPIDNKLQIAAHSYSEGVLEVARDKRSTPKFERAKSMTFDDKKLVYISGTAAIRGEKSLRGVGLEQQLRITMENIEQLTDNARLEMLRIYLKNKEDYEEAERIMQSYHLTIPVSYMCADVCRNELLIEIEGIAIEK